MKNKPPGLIKSVVLRWLGVEIMPGDEAWSALFGESWSGKRVNQQQALQLSTVWACVRLIAETMATLPLALYLKKGDGSRTLAVNHPLYSVIHSQPNASTTAVTFWECVVYSLLLWGNSYCEIKRSGGVIIALNFLRPDWMQTPKNRNTGALEYWYTDNITGNRRQIAEADMMHVLGFSTDGVCGVSPVTAGAQVFGQAAVTDEAAAKSFSNGMRASGFLQTESILTDPQRKQLKGELEAFRGRKDAGGVMVIEAKSSYSPLSMNPKDAQLLESRAWNVEELCRWFRVPPFMVGHSEKSTSWGTGIEQQMIGFITFVLRPWCVRIEQGINKSCLSVAEKARGYYAEFGLEGLLRGDSASRAAFYGIMIDKGILTRDEVRTLENWPVMGEKANVLTVQSATVPLNEIQGGAAAPKAADALKNWLMTE